MYRTTGKPLVRIPEAKVKVKRSEFEDGTIKSLVREGTRLGHTLKQHDRARQVIERELEHDRRQAVKFSRQIRTADLFHMLSLHGDSGSNGGKMHTGTNTRRHMDASSTSPRSPSMHRQYAHRSKTTKAPLKVQEAPTVLNEHSGGHKKGVGMNHQLASRAHEGDMDKHKHRSDSSEHSAHESVKRNTSRKKMFDDLSKPKNRSDVLNVRQRLRNEFGKQRPYSSHVTSVRAPTSPRVVIHGSGPSAVAVLTTRSPTRTQTLTAKDKASLDEIDGDQDMSAANLQILLSAPSPVVVRRSPEER